MMRLAAILTLGLLVSCAAHDRPSGTSRLSGAEYLDRVQGAWVGQVLGMLMGFPFEHEMGAAVPVEGITKGFTGQPLPIDVAPVDDDWYYEMVALNGFEKYGMGKTADQLGKQWLENAAGTWGSSRGALEALLRGVVLRRTLKLGHRPRLLFQAGALPGRSWQLEVYADNARIVSRRIQAPPAPGREPVWQAVEADLSAFAGREVRLRLVQNLLMRDGAPGTAFWKDVRVE